MKIMNSSKEIRYVDGFVLVVPKDKVEAYRQMAEDGAKLWMECGAISYAECMGEDFNNTFDGEPQWLSFPQLVNLKEDETVWFSYITFKSREHRDEVNKKVHAEMGKKYENGENFEMPFDMKRMAYSGFTVEVTR